MKFVLLISMFFSFNATPNQMEPNLRREEPSLRHRNVPGGGGVGLSRATKGLLLNILAAAGWDGIKKAADAGNDTAKEMLKEHKENTNRKIREAQERDRLRDIENGNHDRRGTPIGHGGAVANVDSNPEW